ncbi:MAG: aminotransferase class IV [Oligoflexus sp.]
MEGIISVNGQISSPDEARVPALDRGFLFGDNVFEVFVGFGTKVLDLKEHLARLRQSASNHELPIPWTDDELAFEIHHLMSLCPTEKKFIRLVITRGCGLGLALPEDISPNRVIYCLPAKQEASWVYTDGLRLKRRAMGFTERGAQSKTGNYLRSITALKQATVEGYHDVIWTNSEGEFTEASTANIFFIGRTGDLVEIATPPPTSGLLLGITRSRIMQLLNQAHIPVTERIVSVDELARFDEAFLCSTVRGLVPIAAIDRHRLHTARKQSVFSHTLRLYMAWVESQIGYRVDWNTGVRIEQ